MIKASIVIPALAAATAILPGTAGATETHPTSDRFVEMTGA
ncbi:hypothetical protein [Thermoactinospora rubra]|nr:hypothetical protein [Thermoactinospora rubra]